MHSLPILRRADFFNERWMALLSGSTQTVDLLKGGMDQSAFEWTWRDDIERFAALRTSLPALRTKRFQLAGLK